MDAAEAAGSPLRAVGGATQMLAVSPARLTVWCKGSQVGGVGLGEAGYEDDHDDEQLDAGRNCTRREHSGRQ